MKIKNKTLLSFMSFCLVAGASFAQQIQLEINPNETYQSIDGFGASDAWRCQFVGENWPEAKRNQIAEWLFSKELDAKGNPKGIGLSIWRFYISAGSTEQGEASDIKNEWRRGESFVKEDGSYDWSKQAGQQWFLEKAKAAGVDKFLAFSISAPTFWSLNGKAYGSATDMRLNLQPDRYEDYAKFMTAVLAHFEDKGIHFDYLSPINEPQWDWEKASQEGTPARNQDMARLISLLNKELEAANLTTEMVIGEAADLRYLYSEFGKPQRANQLEEFYGNQQTHEQIYIRDLEKVSNTASGHSYFTTWPVDSLVGIRQQLNEKLNKLDLDYWQSEFCILENSEDIGGGGGKRDLGMATALYVARVIHADLTLVNAKSWQWWTALTIADYKDGLIYLDTGNPDDMYNQKALQQDGEFHDSKLLWALGNYSRFVKPGMHRIASSYATTNDLVAQFKDVMVSAYTNDAGELTLVLINYKDEAKDVVIQDKAIKIEAAYETSETQNLGYRKVKKNSIQLAPKSITTLTGKLK